MKKLILADNQDITRYGMRAAASGIFADVSEVSNRQQLAEHLLLHGDAVAVIDYTLFDCTPEQLLVLFFSFLSPDSLRCKNRLDVLCKANARLAKELIFSLRTVLCITCLYRLLKLTCCNLNVWCSLGRIL